ncbi:hypothetical protein Ahy_A01g003525 isoform A [Arachis hypogaea]|uniref:DUF659 domain-containing protein n=1 Tax=Arachis hypogaea TaxID=3818 RepID=A0A445ETE9_ARAHY|nr:hypothetical protein Ahy_A01g003525 isoform A [Arachis hypogaea]
MASNAREDTQSNNVPTDIEVEVQSNANPTSETPQPTDNNASNPEGSNPVEGDNKANVKSAYWEYFDRFKVEAKQAHVQKVNEDGFVFDPSKTRKCVAEMIILHEYPLSCVDHHGLRRLVASMQPTFKMPSRNTVRKDILKMFGDEKLKLTLQLDKNDSRVAITSDMWTSNQEKGYMVVTAHYIGSSWKLQMRLLRYFINFINFSILCCISMLTSKMHACLFYFSAFVMFLVPIQVKFLLKH